MGLFNFLKPQRGLSNLSTGEKIFEIAKANAAFLNSTYKKLSDEGWFEVIVFNGVLLLKLYKTKKPNLYAQAESDFFKILFGTSKKVGIDVDFETLKNFITRRIYLFNLSLEKIYMHDEEYIPGDLYSAFYETPLKTSIEPSYNVTEIMKFFVVFSQGITTTQSIADREL